ncbi:DUF1826 domain-containing protein [Agaribacterium sp. ZY112]|uniref:DUF1826 domain-containing protein n=1 Tax=Agaribacterium sp. ZY112 TaxID=3233574 RepID=UPI003523D19B
MNMITTAHTLSDDSFQDNDVNTRRAAYGGEPNVFTDIYLENTNIAIWQRQLSPTLKRSVDVFLTQHTSFQTSMTVTPQSALSSVGLALGGENQKELSENITELVDMFCYLFELKRVGLRLTALDSAMCPKFHVDKVPCRLLTTFHGIATEWLPHNLVDRNKLGIGAKGKADSESGLYKHQTDIQQLSCGDVALLKGERWEGNEGAGLVHRSPALNEGERRLILTLDFSS